VKREYKEMEGSQEVKQAQSEFRNEILNEPPSQQAVKDSTVVVTNPTHLAVGVRYMAGETPLPKVVVKGAGTDAALIKRLAAEFDIPVMENVQLARALYSQVKVDDFVPEELFAPLVELLKMIKDIKQTREEEEELSQIKLDDDLDDLEGLEELDKLEELDEGDAPENPENPDSSNSQTIPLGGGKIDLDG
jgi:flagellar biosynthesis protein FlhB